MKSWPHLDDNLSYPFLLSSFPGSLRARDSGPRTQTLTLILAPTQLNRFYTLSSLFANLGKPG